MIESEKELSIVIVSYKNLQVLKQCIDSIIKWNDIGDKLEVIVVDNSPSKDNIYNYLKNHYKVMLIKNENKGFGEGNNVGAKKAKGKYILFLNSDTILIEPIFKYAIDKFESNSKLALFGLKLLKKDLSMNISYSIMDRTGASFILMNKILNALNIFLYKKMFISAADMFIRKDVFINIGMFDENIFIYHEESDLIKRLLEFDKGYEIKFFKDKKIVHIGGESSETDKELIEKREKSNLYYYKKFEMDTNKQIERQFNLLNKQIMINRIFNKKKYKRLIKERDISIDVYKTIDRKSSL